MVTKAEIAALPDDLQRGWNSIGHGLQAAISRRLEPLRQHGEPMSLQDFLHLWIYQTPTGETLARCGATGLPFTAAGLSAPRLLRLHPDHGVARDNLVLVCQAYWRLRSITRLYGEQGHEAVMDWCRAAVAGERPDISATFEEEPQDLDAALLEDYPRGT